MNAEYPCQKSMPSTLPRVLTGEQPGTGLGPTTINIFLIPPYDLVVGSNNDDNKNEKKKRKEKNTSMKEN